MFKKNIFQISLILGPFVGAILIGLWSLMIDGPIFSNMAGAIIGIAISNTIFFFLARDLKKDKIIHY